MVVACRESAEVAEAVEGNGVLRSAEADGSRVLGDLSLSHIVRSLTTDEETVTAKDGVRRESGTLENNGLDAR